MDNCAVGVIRHAQPPSDAQHVAFSRQLGPLLQMKMLLMVGKSKSRLAFPELIDVGNLDVDGSILPDDDRRRAYNRGNLLWHTDGSFDPVRARYSLLSAHVVPPGGAPTEFADMRAATMRCPRKEKTNRTGGRASIWYSRELAGERERRGASHAPAFAPSPGARHPAPGANRCTSRRTPRMS